MVTGGFMDGCAAIRHKTWTELLQRAPATAGTLPQIVAFSTAQAKAYISLPGNALFFTELPTSAGVKLRCDLFTALLW